VDESCASDCVQGWRHSYQAYYHVYSLQTRAAPQWLTAAGQELLQNVMFAPTADAGVFAAFVRSNDVYVVDVNSKAGKLYCIQARFACNVFKVQLGVAVVRCCCRDISTCIHTCPLASYQ
jgi:hypothetical protein